MDATSSVKAAGARAGTRQRPDHRVVVVVALACACAALVGAVAALLLGGGAPVDLPTGISDPGPLVGWSLPAARLAALLAAIAAVGSLMVPAGLAPRNGAGSGCWRAARHASALWALTSLAGYALVVCDVAGVPLAALEPSLLASGVATPSAAAQLATAVSAGVVAVAAGPRAGAARARTLLGICLLSALVVPWSGHTGNAADGGLALGGLAVHVVAALLWAGGLAGLLLHLRGDAETLAVGATRFSRLALGSFVALVGSGLVAASAALPFRGEGWSTPWASGYAAVLAAKIAALLVLGWVGATHRRRTLPRLCAGERRAFVRLASGELVVMAGAAGLATALARTPVPVPVADVHGAAGVVQRPTLSVLLTEWRPDALVLVALGLALSGYLGARRRVVSRGVPWPRARTACFGAGIALAALTLCSGVAVYVPLLLSAHLAQLLVVLLAVPALLVLGRPVTLARLAHGWRPPVAVRRVVAVPWSGAVATCALLTLVHRSVLTVWSLESRWWHLLVVVAALLVGLLLMCQLLGEGGVGRQGRTGSRGWLVVVAASLGVLALQLGTADRLLAGGWFLELRLGWSEPLADQRLAGGLAGVVALALLVAAYLPGQSVDRVPGGGHSDVSTRPSRSSAGTGP